MPRKSCHILHQQKFLCFHHLTALVKALSFSSCPIGMFIRTISHELLEQSRWIWPGIFSSSLLDNIRFWRSKVKVTAGLSMWWQSHRCWLWGVEVQLHVLLNITKTWPQNWATKSSNILQKKRLKTVTETFVRTEITLVVVKMWLWRLHN